MRFQIAATGPPQFSGSVSPRGFTLVELGVASAMMAILLATVLQMLHAVSNHERAADRYATALEAIDAVAEQVSNLPLERLTAESLNQVAVPKAAAPHLPGAKLQFTVHDEVNPAAKRIGIELTWNGPTGQRAGPLRLTTWSFPDRAKK